MEADCGLCLEHSPLCLEHPPRGICCERVVDGVTVIRGRIFSFAMLPFLVIISMWNSGILFFVYFLMTVKSENVVASPSVLCFVWLFLIVMLFIGGVSLYATLLHICGNYEIRLGAGEGSIFKGVGKLGRTRKFSMQSVSSVWAGQGINWFARVVVEMDNGREYTIPFRREAHGTWLVFAIKKILNR